LNTGLKELDTARTQRLEGKAQEKNLDRLPRAVIEAERKANEALERIQAARNPQPPADTSVDPAPQPPADPAVVNTEQTPPQPPAPAPAQGDDEKWEARYKTIAGKYNAEVPRLHQQLKERDSELKGLKDRIELLEAASNKEPLVKPEEVQEFGEPLVDLIRRAAREEIGAKDTEIQQLKAKLDSFEVKTTANTEATFYEDLAKAVPDWMAINDDPEFHKWLAEHDELTGFQRQQILSAAEANRDATRVARFFSAFKKVQEGTAAAASTTLESQVAPTTSRVDAPPQGKKIWTRAEIADFYAKDRRGAYTEEQSAAIDSEIQLAIVEQRVR
jgi:hypothetical protein